MNLIEKLFLQRPTNPEQTFVRSPGVRVEVGPPDPIPGGLDRVPDAAGVIVAEVAVAEGEEGGVAREGSGR